MPAGRPLKFKTPEELREKAEEYFAACEAANKPILITGLAYHLETTRETLCDYQEKDEFSDTVKRIKLRAEIYAESQVFEGKNAAGPIFILKNYGWSDKTQTELTGPNGSALPPMAINVTFGKGDDEATAEHTGNASS